MLSLAELKRSAERSQGSTGHVQTKNEFLTGVRENFKKNPNREALGTINRHDDFTVRRFGNTVIQLGRSTTINNDKSEGPVGDT